MLTDSFSLQKRQNFAGGDRILKLCPIFAESLSVNEFPFPKCINTSGFNSDLSIKDISRGLADSGAVNQNPGPESATCWLFPDPDLAKSWLYPDPESANPQVEWFVPIGTNHHLGGVASQAGRSFWPGPPSPTEELFSIL